MTTLTMVHLGSNPGGNAGGISSRVISDRVAGKFHHHTYTLPPARHAATWVRKVGDKIVLWSRAVSHIPGWAGLQL